MPVAMAESQQDVLKLFAEQAKVDNPAFTGFDRQRGEQFFQQTHGAEWACASCHTGNPLQPGKHAVTEKTIEPLAPAMNPKRFTVVEKVEKWFKRNCKDVVGRECLAQEKGDILAYLLTLG